MQLPIYNTTVRRDFEILETFEAGLVLTGSEVKSLRNGHATINEAFIVFEDGALYLVKAYIAPYQLKNQVGYNPYQHRKLLVSKKQIRDLIHKKSEKGLTLVPISLYNKGRLIKLQLGLVRGLKKHDKREVLKKRDAKREIDQLMKRG